MSKETKEKKKRVLPSFPKDRVFALFLLIGVLIGSAVIYRTCIKLYKAEVNAEVLGTDLLSIPEYNEADEPIVRQDCVILTGLGDTGGYPKVGKGGRFEGCKVQRLAVNLESKYVCNKYSRTCKPIIEDKHYER